MLQTESFKDREEEGKQTERRRGREAERQKARDGEWADKEIWAK